MQELHGESVDLGLPLRHYLDGPLQESGCHCLASALERARRSCAYTTRWLTRFAAAVTWRRA
jgi:hypothetical protein